MPTTKLDSEEEETDATVEETSSSSSSPSQRHSSLKAEPTTVFGLQKQRRVRKQRHHCLLHNNSNDDLLQSPVGFHWVPSPAAASTSSSSSSSSRSPRRQKCTRKPQISQILSFILFAVLYRLVDCQRTSPAAGAGIQKQLQQQLNSTTTNSSNGSATEETPSSSTEEEKITNFFSSSSSPSEILPSLVTESTVSTPAPLLTAKATPPGEINRSISGGSREVEDDRFPTPAVVFLTTSTSAGSRNDDDPSGGQTPIASLNQSLTQPSVSTTVKTTPSAVASAAGNLQNQQQPSDSDEDEQSTSAEEFVASSLNVSNTTTTPLQPAMKRPDHFELISFNWRHVEAPFTVALWLLLASVAKIRAFFLPHTNFSRECSAKTSKIDHKIFSVSGAQTVRRRNS